MDRAVSTRGTRRSIATHGVLENIVRSLVIAVLMTPTSSHLYDDRPGNAESVYQRDQAENGVFF